jgi:hypothetical protein
MGVGVTVGIGVGVTVPPDPELGLVVVSVELDPDSTATLASTVATRTSSSVSSAEKSLRSRLVMYILERSAPAARDPYSRFIVIPASATTLEFVALGES